MRLTLAQSWEEFQIGLELIEEAYHFYIGEDAQTWQFKNLPHLFLPSTALALCWKENVIVGSCLISRDSHFGIPHKDWIDYSSLNNLGRIGEISIIGVRKGENYKQVASHVMSYVTQFSLLHFGIKNILLLLPKNCHPLQNAFEDWSFQTLHVKKNEEFKRMPEFNALICNEILQVEKGFECEFPHHQPQQINYDFLGKDAIKKALESGDFGHSITAKQMYILNELLVGDEILGENLINQFLQTSEGRLSIRYDIQNQAILHDGDNICQLVDLYDVTNEGFKTYCTHNNKDLTRGKTYKIHVKFPGGLKFAESCECVWSDQRYRSGFQVHEPTHNWKLFAQSVKPLSIWNDPENWFKKIS